LIGAQLSEESLISGSFSVQRFFPREAGIATASSFRRIASSIL